MSCEGREKDSAWQTAHPEMRAFFGVDLENSVEAIKAAGAQDR
jgi:hypothetical protein